MYIAERLRPCNCFYGSKSLPNNDTYCFYRYKSYGDNSIFIFLYSNSDYVLDGDLGNGFLKNWGVVFGFFGLFFIMQNHSLHIHHCFPAN